jgi:threonine dehydratase
LKLSDIEAAEDVLTGITRVTPVETSRWLSEHVGSPVFLKTENLQRTGSFKTRGAYVRLSRLSAEERARGVVAASAGNHAQGVALSAQLLGIHSTVFMPEGAPIPKENATRAYGADVILQGAVLEESLAAAKAFAAETGATFIHPYDHPDVVAGQGTVALEILRQVPEARTIVVPTGGGGLLSGIALAAKESRPDIRMIGVQAAGAASYPASLAADEPLTLQNLQTMADGIAVARPGDVNLPLVRDYVDDILTVSEEAISHALLLTLERAKLIVEPAGVVGVAALLEQPSTFEGPVVVVLSGGNVDPLLLGKIIRHGLAAAGRYLTVDVAIGDSPGNLARLLNCVAKAGANVLEVSHLRTDPLLSVDEVEVHLQLETRGEPHAAALLAAIEASGYSTRRSSKA